MNQKIYPEWVSGYSKNREALPAEWVQASVPGAVQLDHARAKNWQPYWYGKNWKDYLWMEDCFWIYRTKFAHPGLEKGEVLLFRSRGIDYQYQVRINGMLVYEYEGMFNGFDIDISPFLKEVNQLEVLIFPAPKSHKERMDRTQANQSCKPAVSYLWDWHPRLIPLGIWDETWLEKVPASRIEKAEVGYTLNADLSQAKLNLRVKLNNPSRNQTLTWSMTSPDGTKQKLMDVQAGRDDISINFELNEPELWWPRNYGKQSLYIFEAVLTSNGKEMSAAKIRTGFRRAELLMNEGAWNEPHDFPKSRSVAPIALCINGKKIFTKGTNWVPPTIFPGTIDRQTCERLIGLALDAHLDMFRVWGGGPVNKDFFYGLCDEKGMMVWQEFPLACNLYPDTYPYLQTLENEGRAIIDRLLPHPSHVIWCGGNELFNVWSGMTDQSLPLRLLNKLCLELDPQIPFLATAPLMGMGHGPYGFLDPVTREEIFTKMIQARNTAYSECSSTGPALYEKYQEFIPTEELYPPLPGTSWEDHHGFMAWDAEPESHLLLGMLRKYFGKEKDLKELTEWGHFIQKTGIQCLFEEARRQKPYCSMVLNWCYNEAWPSAASGAVICWPADPKPAYFAMKESCRTVLASAQIIRLVWEEGSVFECGIWLLNDGEAIDRYHEISVYAEGDSSMEILRWKCPPTDINRNITGPIARFVLPGWDCSRFRIRVSVTGKPEWDSVYELIYQKKGEQKSGARGMNV